MDYRVYGDIAAVQQAAHLVIVKSACKDSVYVLLLCISSELVLSGPVAHNDKAYALVIEHSQRIDNAGDVVARAESTAVSQPYLAVLFLQYRRLCGEAVEGIQVRAEVNGRIAFALFIDAQRSFAVGIRHRAYRIGSFVDTIGEGFERGKSHIAHDRDINDHLERFGPQVLNIDDKAYTVFLAELCGCERSCQRGHSAVYNIGLFAPFKVSQHILSPYAVAVKPFDAHILRVAGLFDEPDLVIKCGFCLFPRALFEMVKRACQNLDLAARIGEHLRKVFEADIVCVGEIACEIGYDNYIHIVTLFTREILSVLRDSRQLCSSGGYRL